MDNENQILIVRTSAVGHQYKSLRTVECTAIRCVPNWVTAIILKLCKYHRNKTIHTRYLAEGESFRMIFGTIDDD